MKARLIGFLVVFMLTACMNHMCPTYSGSKRYSETVASAKKIKAVKNKKPYFKTVKKAEQD